MPRIKLANWHGEHAPGAELDVDDVELKALRRDGRVAEVVEPAAEPARPEPAADAPETGRKKR
jgi:hypothetical protein